MNADSAAIATMASSGIRRAPTGILDIARPRWIGPANAATIVRPSASRAIADGRHTVRKLIAKREPSAVPKVASASRPPMRVAAATGPMADSPIGNSTAARGVPAAVPAAPKGKTAR